jgi:trans-aconitate methyltransferase
LLGSLPIRRSAFSLTIEQSYFELMDATLARQIASAYLPSRSHYYYTRSKLTADPLYDGVCAVLAESHAPVLDLGCGIGMLAHCLRAKHLTMPYLGVDNDIGKVQLARRAAGVLNEVSFEVGDLASAVPTHRGSVAILDVMQYLPRHTQQSFLHRACECIGEGAYLVIRTGMTDNSWRSKMTLAADVLGRAIRWMNTGPKGYPDRESMDRIFAAHGLASKYQPLWGNTPFNNWLITAVRN